MKKPANQRMRELERLAISLGLTVDRTANNHLKIYKAGGKGMVIVGTNNIHHHVMKRQESEIRGLLKE